MDASWQRKVCAMAAEYAVLLDWAEGFCLLHETLEIVKSENICACASFKRERMESKRGWTKSLTTTTFKTSTESGSQQYFEDAILCIFHTIPPGQLEVDRLSRIACTPDFCCN
jgi:hypothetical protein